MSEGVDTLVFEFESMAGKPVIREVNPLLDIRAFEGTAIYPWLFMAAAKHLSVRDVVECLYVTGGGAGRTRSWIQRHRWMLRRPDEQAGYPRLGDDGRGAQALRIIRANPRLSAAKLARLLKEHGIKRNREFVRRHRCD